MKIYIKELTDQEKEYETNYKSSELDLGIEKILLIDNVNVKLTVRKLRSEIIVRYKYLCKIDVECVRCIKTFESFIKNQGLFSYELEKNPEFIDVTCDVREDIILNYPQKPLCSEGCKGLCSVCGKNLNFSSCSCKHITNNSPFLNISLKEKNKKR